MRSHRLESEQIFGRSLAEVFAFFCDPVHLSAITPPWLHFQVLTPPPIVMRAGTLIDYRLRVRGLPLRWQSEITVWEPPRRFVDVQRRGPYRQWIHEHLFEETSAGTKVADRVDYAVPGWILAPLIRRWLVGPDVERIFAYRRQKLTEIFQPLAALHAGEAASGSTF